MLTLRTKAFKRIVRIFLFVFVILFVCVPALGVTAQSMTRSVEVEEAASQNDTTTIIDNSVITEQKQATEAVSETQSTVQKPELKVEEAIEVTEPVKSDEEIADEVIKGLWGNGEDRKARLTAAGRDYEAIQKIVSEKVPSSPKQTTQSQSYTSSSSVCDNPLTPSMGVKYFNGHRETWYSQRVLPGTGLKIPGRHVASDGTIRDADNYIVLASDLSYAPRGTIIMTSLGPGKVYDTGCAYGTIDIYTDW
jgi:hypothetical protein